MTDAPHLTLAKPAVTWPDELFDVLKRAAARFPNAGQLYFQAANAYYSIDRYNDALESIG